MSAVTEEMVMLRTIAAMLDHPSVYMGGPSQRNMRRAEQILAAVGPIIAAQERERCALVADGIVSEYQEQIGDAIESGLRSIEADGLRRRRAAERVAAAIRALGDAT